MVEPLIMNKYDIKTDTYKNFVAVLVSPGFGAGWSTWNCPEMAYDERLTCAWYAHEVCGEEVDIPTFQKLALEYYPDAYLNGAWDLKLRWIECGRKFMIHEYDGSETIQFEDEMGWMCFD